MNVQTIRAKSAGELAEQLERCTEEGFQPTLALVFASPAFDLEAVAAAFDERGIDLFGCSSAGEIANGEVLDTSAVGLLLDLDRGSYAIHFSEYGRQNPFSACREAGRFAREKFANPALLVGSGGVTVDAEQIVLGLKAGVGGEVPIFGGLAGDDLEMSHTFAFCRRGVTSNGIVALALDHDKVEVKGLATSGWEAVGVENLITKAEGNVVHTINHEPALDVFIKYFGFFDNSEVKGRSISTISAQYPLQFLREDGATVLRSPVQGNEADKTLVLAAGVREGEKFRFSISPGFEVIDQTVSEVGDFHRSALEADALVLFSCKGRHAALGPMIEDEVQGIYDFWKKPMVGLFTYGEIGPTKSGTCEFHNETCSLVVLRER